VGNSLENSWGLRKTRGRIERRIGFEALAKVGSGVYDLPPSSWYVSSR
jgi:hypothetical protein